jgi:polyisoprenoid-binding protein YceI
MSLLAIAWLAAPAAMARELPAWRIDPTHSRVVFDVEHAGFSHSLAVLSKPEGRLRFDPDGWDGGEVEVVMPLAHLDFGDADWNRTMRGRRWFDAEAHPEIRFRSTRVEAIDAQHATVHGELTVRGTTAPVRLDVRRNAVKRHPLTLRRTAGFSATAELDRRAFGLDGSPNLIGSTVRVRIEVEAVRTRQENDDATPKHD